MSKTYKIEVKEIYTKEILVEAESNEEAQEIVNDLLKSKTIKVTIPENYSDNISFPKEVKKGRENIYNKELFPRYSFDRLREDPLETMKDLYLYNNEVVTGELADEILDDPKGFFFYDEESVSEEEFLKVIKEACKLLVKWDDPEEY